MAWIENPQGDVLMVRQLRGKKLWALPGGKVKMGESLKMALRREVHEESGLTVSAARPIALYDRFSKNNLTVLFRISVRPFKGFKWKDPKEIAAVEFRPSLPSNSTPSMKYFFRKMKQQSEWV